MARSFWQKLRRRLFKRHYYRRAYKQHYGRTPNLRHPQRFSEHLYVVKLNADPRMSARTDKVLAKQFVAEALGPEWLIPTIWRGRELPPRAERTWPMPFILKANHGSGWSVIVRSQDELDWDHIEERCSRWLSRTYGVGLLEPHYAGIVPQILVEPLLGDPSRPLVDYRIYCFGGVPRFIRLRVGEQHDDEFKEVCYDPDWSRLPYTIKYEAAPDQPRPRSLDAMLRAAAVLSSEFDFVRVDFYEVDGRPLFGEMTFTPASGNMAQLGPELDLAMGAWWPRRAH